MDVFLIRHGDAETHGADEERPLTARGREELALVARGLDRLGVRWERCWHSPLRRAVETAAVLRRLARSGCEETPLLARDPGDELLALIAREAAGSVALVGHQPWMAELCGILVHGMAPSGNAISFPKAGVAWLEGSPARAGMTVRAILPPDVTTVLARGDKP